jgi:D-alanyl-D-alanine carboxypeptidase/D-alanyl-D-alanine-endopeptidase (penicillin-binding protein 4)
MNRCPLLTASLFLSCIFLVMSTAGADLTKNLDAALGDASLAKAQVGVEIVHLGSSAAKCTVLFRHNGDLPLAPASNLKLLTTSAALDRLGADFKFRTQLVYHHGDLILIGDGDPAFGDAEMLSRVGWDVDTVFKNWAAQIKAMKLGPIKNVVVDDSIFDTEFFQPDWAADQRLDWYEAEVAGMNLNINCLDFFLRPTQPGKPVIFMTNPAARFFSIRNQCTTGAGRVSIHREAEADDLTIKGEISSANEVPLRVTIHDPTLFAANVLAATLTNAGIPHSGDVHRDRTVRDAMLKAKDGKGWQLVGVNQTPIALALARANKNSINLYGECLCKRLGAEVSGLPGSWENGTAAVGAFLKKIGVPEADFHLDDGCGLSKQNRITASAMARVLIHDYFSPDAKTLIDSLAVAGTEGTLLERFRAGTLRGRVLAKTGTIDGVSCLSGYLHARDGQWYAFSILINKSYNGAGKPTQEAIVSAVDEMDAKR